MALELNRIILYTRNPDETAAFYCGHFSFDRIDAPADRITELRPRGGGAVLMLHPAGKGQRQGQAQVKLVFDTQDVAGTRDALIAAGLTVGPLHDGSGYAFANLKDPAGNSVQISGRAFRDG